MRELVYLLTILNGVGQNSGIKKLIQYIFASKVLGFYLWSSMRKSIYLPRRNLSEENRNSVSGAVFVFILPSFAPCAASVPLLPSLVALPTRLLW